MGRLRRISGQDACRILEANGFCRIRQKGSHIVMQRQLPDTTITAIVPDHDELNTGTLSSIIRQSQLDRSLFES